MKANALDNTNSRYDEQMKREIALIIEDWVLRSYRFREDEVSTHLNIDHEMYVTIEVSNPDADPMWQGFEADVIERVIRGKTDYHIRSIPIENRLTVSIIPENVKKEK